MSTVALSRRFGFPAIDDGVGLLGLPAEQSAKRRLSGSADEIVTTIAGILDEMVLGVIEKRTAVEFEAASNEALPAYVSLVLSYAQIAATIVPNAVLERLTLESFSELEADIREHGVQAFGSDMRDRAVFTVWTLRKTAALLHLLATKVAECEQKRDNDFHINFLIHALRARFNVDCLRASMRTGRPIYPDALGVVDDGLRSAVNAYAWIKQAVDLRFPSDESQVLPDYWTADDEKLLGESMQELAEQEKGLSDEEPW
jgi:hypothetical protein